MKKVLFFGDSNTYGYDPSGFMGGRYPENVRWTTMVQNNLIGIWKIVADGMPGRALPVTRYEWDYLRAAIEKASPVDLFAVMLGTNDLLGTLRPDAAAVARRMDDLITFVQRTAGELAESGRQEAGIRTGMPEGRHGPAAEPSGSAAEPEDADAPKGMEILLIAPPEISLTDQSYAEPYVAGDRTCAELYHEEGQKLSRYYRELADDRGVRFVDASRWELSFAFDGVHLSESGHVAFAAEMLDVLRRIWYGPTHSCESCMAR